MKVHESHLNSVQIDAVFGTAFQNQMFVFLITFRHPKWEGK